MGAVVEAKIAAATPAVKAILEKVDAAVKVVIEKAEAGIEQGKGLLVQLLEKIMAKLAELKDNLTGYNIFDDLLNDVLKPAIKHAIENLIPTIGKSLGSFLQRHDCARLEPKICLEILRNFTNQTWNGSLRNNSSVDLWYLLISRRATVPGL